MRSRDVATTVTQQRAGEHAVKDVRQDILGILKERGQATVTDLAEALGRPAVSVRHHLDILREQGMIRRDGVQQRASRGRPRHIYVLTESANLVFPNRYEGLARELLREMKHNLAPELVEAFFDRLAAETAGSLSMDPQKPIEERLAMATRFLSDKGYLAGWEQQNGSGYLLHVFNCPYKGLQPEHSELCNMDLALISRVLQMNARRVEHAVAGDHRCTYLIE